MLNGVLSLALQTQAATHLLVIAGIGGEPQFRTRFNAWATALIEVAVERFEVPRHNVHYLAESTELAPGLVEARSTRENLENLVTDLAATAGPQDQIFVVMIGHGSELNGTTKFNLPGPDITPSDLGTLLGLLGERPVTVINTSSSSGGFLEALSRPNRIIITATRSGRERNETKFAGFFVNAFTGGNADADKDNRVSVLEAFNFARIEVARIYQQANQIQTEHAMLDDNGDGEGSTEPDPLTGDGALARRTFLSGGTATVLAGQPGDDPELALLYVEKARLEEAIQQLRGEKARMSEDDYQDRLEELLVDLTAATRAIREREEAR